MKEDNARMELDEHWRIIASICLFRVAVLEVEQRSRYCTNAMKLPCLLEFQFLIYSWQRTPAAIQSNPSRV